MDCPRCHLLLTDSEYEGEQVGFCGTCWGYWLKRSQLDEITSDMDYSFSEGEVQAVSQSLNAGDADRQGSEADAVQCPECQGQMERKRYKDDCPVLIDECSEHGVWLDTGEIKDLQVFMEQKFSPRK